MADKCRGSLLESENRKRRGTEAGGGLSANRREEPARAATFRISEIPVLVSKEQLITCIAEIFPSDPCDDPTSTATLAASLAPSASDSKRYQVATVTFESIPRGLLQCFGSNLSESLSMGVEGAPPFEVTIDSHFIGLTRLNDSVETCDVE
jgi:hypothetical protein